jgi:hypothetical protein
LSDPNRDELPPASTIPATLTLRPQSRSRRRRWTYWNPNLPLMQR